MNRESPDLQAALFDRYHVLERLGEGGFGLVLKGVQANTNQTVAIKVLKDTASASHVERFRREMALLARLPNHPHLVNLIDSGDFEGRPFIVLEFIEGVDLAAHLKKSGPLSPQLAQRVMVQTLEALHAVHQANIVHRDLKPANIMLTGSIERPLVKLLDFGIATLDAREPDEQSDWSPLTQTGKLIGTPSYMAPELAKIEATPRSDIFAMGIILLECLTSERTSEQLLPPHLEVFTPIIERACAFNPNSRYTSALEMIDAIESLPRHASSTPIAHPPLPPISSEHVVPHTPRPPHSLDSHPLVDQQPEVGSSAENVSPKLVTDHKPSGGRGALTYVLGVLALLAVVLGGVIVNQASSPENDARRADEPTQGASTDIREAPETKETETLAFDEEDTTSDAGEEEAAKSEPTEDVDAPTERVAPLETKPATREKAREKKAKMASARDSRSETKPNVQPEEKPHEAPAKATKKRAEKAKDKGSDIDVGSYIPE